MDFIIEEFDGGFFFLKRVYKYYIFGFFLFGNNILDFFIFVGYFGL